MKNLRFYTAGESHGQGLVGVIDGLPANVPIAVDEINQQLFRRQQGYGRGGRMKIEKDQAKVLSGIRFGATLGSPVSLFIENRDWKNWQDKMAVEGEPGKRNREVDVPRPGHADLAGAIKYNQKDMRNILERASARETTTRVALAAIAKQFLAQFGIGIASHVLQMVDVKGAHSLVKPLEQFPCELTSLNTTADASPVRCLDPEAEKGMMALIDQAKKERNTVGGIFEVVAYNLPVGLGSHVHWDRKLDGRIAAAMMSIQAMKAVEIGDGFGGACRFGSEVHDEIYYDDAEQSFYRKRNNAGGLEGGITNGMPLVVRVAMKPIATLMRPLDSVDLHSKEATAAHRERSDVCAVPAASVIGEAMLALVLADAILEKFGGDSLEEMQQRYEAWQEYVKAR